MFLCHYFLWWMAHRKSLRERDSPSQRQWWLGQSRIYLRVRNLPERDKAVGEIWLPLLAVLRKGGACFLRETWPSVPHTRSHRYPKGFFLSREPDDWKVWERQDLAVCLLASLFPLLLSGRASFQPLYAGKIDFVFRYINSYLETHKSKWKLIRGTGHQVKDERTRLT